MQIPEEEEGGGGWAWRRRESREGAHLFGMDPPIPTSGAAASQTVDTLIAVGNVQKEVFFVVFLARNKTF